MTIKRENQRIRTELVTLIFQYRGNLFAPSNWLTERLYKAKNWNVVVDFFCFWFDESSVILASYCNGYTDREEFENEKRRKKNGTPRSLPILPLVVRNKTVEPAEEASAIL